MKLILLFMVCLVGCSYEASDPGLCRLNCSKAIIGGNDSNMLIELKSPTSTISCPLALAGEALEDPLLAQFVISEKFTDGSENGGKRPVPMLSFEPVVNGARSTLPEHNPNVTIEGNDFKPARYKGIVTPKSNWCSDTCGVATLEIFARCPPSGESTDVAIKIHTGALYSETATFTISTPAPQ